VGEGWKPRVSAFRLPLGIWYHLAASWDGAQLCLWVNGGSVGDVVFVSSRGAGRIRFATHADGQMHTYVLEPWQDVNWGGKLLALGLVTDEAAAVQATLEYVRLTAEPAGVRRVPGRRVGGGSPPCRADRPGGLSARPPVAQGRLRPRAGAGGDGQAPGLDALLPALEAGHPYRLEGDRALP
jgi:hypothetical protein